MDATKKQTLIKTLAVAKSFDENLPAASQAWFVETVINAREAAGDSDAQIEQKAKDLIAASKSLVAAERDFALAITASGNARYTPKLLGSMRRHRVEILYGLIAREPRLADAVERDHLRFLAKRRFHSVCRMFVWVNPNSQGYFRYPHKCRADQRWRVNEDAAATHWQPLSPPKDLPIGFKPAGTADPVAALQKLYVAKSDVCKCNLFDCAVTAEIMFVDALSEAKNATTFLTALPSEFVQIQHMDYSAFAKQPAATENPISRIRLDMPPRDLQVGDQCYIYNHPLYKSFRPTGSWTGEFSYVFGAGNRDHRSKKGFVFGGHGKEGTLFDFYSAFVSELATYLALARQLAQAHLAFMAGGAAAIAPGTVTDDLEDAVEIYDPIADSYRAAATHRVLAYDLQVMSRDFTKIPTKAKRKPKTVQPGFLVVQSKTEQTFYLAKVDQPDEDQPLTKNLKRVAADLPAPRKVRYPIKMTRLTAPAVGATTAEIYAIESWGVAYSDLATSSEKIWAFFSANADGDFERHELTTDKKEPVGSLFDTPFYPFTKGGGDVETYQPRVDFGAHRVWLAANGAF